jgi:methylmalonyl-CoA/ethylmalonyl-CoA epimerase
MLDAASFRFHHLGVACRDIRREAEGWKTLGYAAEEPEFHDPIQRVRGCFLTGLGPRLELLEPAGDGSPLDGVLARGAKIYHQGFTAFAFERALDHLQASGLKAVSSPAPAVAFGGRRVCFFMTPTLNLIEIIEADR